tara:strand:+ start:334 stop:846 length:513 start_codon:yes stop_codon:yes gene_type:complete
MFKNIKRYYSTNLVYILKLNNNKYYIGKTNNLNKRIQQHQNNTGASWTKNNKIKDILKFKNKYKFLELEKTLEYMHKYGIDNVRGSMFTKYNLSIDDKITAAKLYCELNDLCRKCGSKNHFVKQCLNEKVEPWVHRFGGKLEDERRCFICNKPLTNSEYNIYCEDCYHIY